MSIKDQKVPIHSDIYQMRKIYEYLNSVFKNDLNKIEENMNYMEKLLSSCRIQASCAIPENMPQVILENRFELMKIWLLTGKNIFYEERIEQIPIGHDDKPIKDPSLIQTEDGKINEEYVKSIYQQKIFTEMIIGDNKVYICQFLSNPPQKKLENSN